MGETIKFTKMHGAGNDYIYVNTLSYNVPNPSKVAATLSDRHKGIGGDGLVLIGTSPVPDADFSMRMFNADGSEGEMCGNASRCVGKYLFERGLTKKTKIRLYTLSGIKVLHLHLKNDCVESVTVDMGEPVMNDERFFVPAEGLPEGVFVSMGCPHYVVFTDDVDDVDKLGGELEFHPSFPQRCNIDFVRDEGNGKLRVRVWERGSGITMACGTGACASAVAASLKGLGFRKYEIHMDGGVIHVEWRTADNQIYMTGGAEFVFDGEVSLPADVD